MKQFWFAAGLLATSIAPGYGFEKVEPYRPPALTDCGAGLGIILSGGASCLQLSGREVGAIGAASNADPVYSLASTGRLAIIVDKSNGTGVVMGLSSSRVPDWNGGYLDDVHVNEGFLNLSGGAGSVRFGYFDPEFDSLDDIAVRDWIVDLPPFILETTPYLETFMPVGGLGAQVRYVSGNFAGGLAVENLEGRWSLGPGAGTGIATASYDDGVTSATVTALVGGIVDGTIDDWGLKAAVETDLGPMTVQLDGTYQGTGHWIAGVLSRLQVGEVYFGLGVDGSQSDGESAAGSIDLGDEDLGPSAGLAIRYLRSLTYFDIAQAEAKASTVLWDQLKLALKAGLVVTSDPAQAPTYYAKTGITWEPAKGTIFSAGATANSLAAYGLAFGVEQRLQ